MNLSFTAGTFTNCFLLVAVCSLMSCTEQPQEKDGMVLIKGKNEIEDFWLDVSPVTVSEFAEFVAATNYATQAEQFGDAGVFNMKNGKWEMVSGANWRYPFGSDSSAAQADHPVTQVSWNDAIAYCRWANKRLPTSQEFMFAEKNGDPDYDKNYTWGFELVENGSFKANTWQGTFPITNTGDDGFLSTSPVGYFGKNELNLTDMGGNVWQWCSDEAQSRKGEMNQRGGSFLCDPLVCHGYKVGGVSSSTPETSLFHVGFRCAKNAK